jgi:hypothetical protein
MVLLPCSGLDGGAIAYAGFMFNGAFLLRLRLGRVLNR